MLEFLSVQPSLYTNPETGEDVEMRILHRPLVNPSIAETVDANQDMDLIANRMGGYDELLRLCDANVPLLCEYDFDNRKLGKISVPS